MARAQDVEKTLSDSLSTETARATAAEKTLTDSLASEVTRAQGTEKVLTDNLATEVTRAKAAEKINTDNITAEANPVSYTHLDVYKRQLIDKARELSSLFMGGFNIAFGDTKVLDNIKQSIDCLLYTSRCV